MSTTNHYILYFVCVSGISLLNTRLYLWKALNTLALRGFREPNFAPILVQPPFGQPIPASAASLVLPAIRNKAQNRCTLPFRLCELWRFSINSNQKTPLNGKQTNIHLDIA